MPSELKNNFIRWYNEDHLVAQNSALNFREDIQSLVIHTSNSWPSRDKAIESALANGRSYHVRIAGCGTMYQRVDFEEIGYHALGVSGRNTASDRVNRGIPGVRRWSLGVSLLNRVDRGIAPNENRGRWRTATGEDNIQNNDNNLVDDIPGHKLFITRDSNLNWEISACWWTTENYDNTFPGRRNSPDWTDARPNMMIFQDIQYRRLASLNKYLLELKNLPRNFPLLPHQYWSKQYPIVNGNNASNSRWDPLRRIILADERRMLIVREFANPTHFDPGPRRPDHAPQAGADFWKLDSSFRIGSSEDDQFLIKPYLENDTILHEKYINSGVITIGQNQQRYLQFQNGLNKPWRRFFSFFRGVHGHGFAQHSRGDCPGPLFDWHRLAREVSDYWWYPFDLDDTVTKIDDDFVVAGDRIFRSYRRFNENTPILDYYWDEHENVNFYRAIETDSVMAGDSPLPELSPATFNLPNTALSTPIYAMANGELVAAKFPLPGEDISSGFVLVKHEVFHDTSFPGNMTPDRLSDDSINFNKKPSIIYTLYMHLSRPNNMNFDQINDHNPDWLNRVLIRKKECDLGIAFRNTAQGRGQGFDNDRWDNRPPLRAGHPQNPTTLESWDHDNRSLDEFIFNLRNGNVAMPVVYDDYVQSVNIILGDYIGDSGSIGNSQKGVRIEVFSPNFSPPGFEVYGTEQSLNGWNSNLQPNSSQYYISEWNETDWWQAVISQMAINTNLPVNDRIHLNTPTYHFHPLEFMEWINQVTWKHEWPKFKVKNSDGSDTDRPTRPRTRRIPPAS